MPRLQQQRRVRGAPTLVGAAAPPQPVWLLQLRGGSVAARLPLLSAPCLPRAFFPAELCFCCVARLPARAQGVQALPSRCWQPLQGWSRAPPLLVLWQPFRQLLRWLAQLGQRVRLLLLLSVPTRVRGLLLQRLHATPRLLRLSAPFPPSRQLRRRGLPRLLGPTRAGVPPAQRLFVARALRALVGSNGGAVRPRPAMQSRCSGALLAPQPAKPLPSVLLLHAGPRGATAQGALLLPFILQVAAGQLPPLVGGVR